MRLRYEVAGAVGSDVPFFLWPGPQLSMGRGTVLKEIVLPGPLHVVIALPGLALSTPTSTAGSPSARRAPRRCRAPAFVARTQALYAA